MGLQKKLELIILIVLWLLQLSKAANNLFTDTFYNNFEGNNDKVISDSKSSNKRSASYSISHGIKGATSFMVGIADFDLVNSNFLDFNLYNSTVASKNPTTLTLDVGPNVGISSMAYHVIVSLTDSICVIPMNFSKHTNFKNLFSIGSGPRNLTYTVPYIAPNLTKFSADLVAVISFNRINATFPDYFCLKSYVHQVNRTHVIFSLQTDMSTNFYDLGGTVLIISPDVTSSYGLQHNRLSLDPPARIKYNTQKLTASDKLYIYPNFFPSRPPKLIVYTNTWNTSNAPSLAIRASFSYEPNNVSVITFYYRVTQGSCLSALEVNMLYACSDDDNCLSPLGYTPQIQVITPLRTDIKGDEISINTNDFRSTTYNYMFNQFFSNVPKYAALGIFRLQISTNFRYFSAKIDSIQSQSIKYTVTIGPSSYVLGLGVALMASDFDGLQFYFVDVSTHPLFVSVFQQSTGLRFITIEVPFQSSLDLSIKKNATFFFTELNISNTTANTTLRQAFRSSNSTHVLIDIITEDDISWNGIKGYVAIYTQGPSDSNFELNLYSFGNDPIFYNQSNTRRYYQNVTFKTLYPSNPNAESVLTGFKLTNLDPLVQFSCEANPSYNNITFGMITSGILSANYGRLYETNAAVFAFNPDPTTKPYFMDQENGANATINQTIKLRIPDPEVYDYILMIGDKPRYVKFLNPRFSGDFATPPRITTIYKFVILDDTYMSVIVQPFETPSQRVTFNVLPIYQGDIWAISIHQITFQHFFSANTVPFFEWLGKLEYADFSDTQKNFSTLVASKFLLPNNNVVASCQMNISFSGIIRSLFVNSDFLLTESSLDISITKIVQTFRRTTLDPNRLVMVTVVGRNLSVYNLSFVNCTDLQNNPLSVGFITYYAKGTNISFTDLTYPNNTRCDQLCLSCKNLTFCYRCQSNYYQYQGKCYSQCPSPLYPTINFYCDIVLRNQGIRNQPITYNPTNSFMYLDYSVDYGPNNNFVLTILFPEKIDYTQLPLIKERNYDYNTAESSEGLTRIINRQNMASYNTSFKTSITVNRNQLLNIYALSTTANNFLIANYSSSDLMNAIILSTYIQNSLYNMSFPSTNALRIQFILSCSDVCRLTFVLDGNLQVYYNYRTTILQLKNASNQTYELKRNFTGVSFLMFEIQNSSMFSLNISGTYRVYSPRAFLFEDSYIAPPINNCSIYGCQNCASNLTCLSCSEGRFLTLGSRSCIPQCFTDYPFNIPERRCFCSDNIECIFPQNSKCDSNQGLCVACNQDFECIHLKTAYEGIICDSGTCKSCPANCMKCNSTTCFTCNSGFKLINGKCICRPGTTLVTPNSCKDVCGDGIKPASASSLVCDDNNTVSGDGCSSLCIIEDGFTCQGGGPFTSDFCYKKPDLNIIQAASSSVFIVTFTQPMVFPANLSDIFDVGLENIPSSDFLYVMKILTNRSISIEIIPLSKIPKSTLIITAKDLNSTRDVYGSQLASQTYAINMKAELKIEAKKYPELTKALEKFGTIVSSTAAATSGVIFITSFNPAIIWGLLNLFQLFYCLQLINVDYPDNVQSFFNIFSIGRLNMIPNPLEKIAQLIGEEGLQVPNRFDSQGMNGLFLVNSGPMMVLWALCLGFYAYCYLLSKYFVKTSKLIKTLALKMRYAFEKGGMLQLWIGSYFDIAISMCLQFYAVKFNSIFRVVSFLCAFGFLCLNLIIPWREYKHPISMAKKRQNPLYREFVEHPAFKHNYVYVLMLRRLSIAFVLVFLHDYPGIEVGCLLGIHVIPTLVTIFASPYKKKHIRIIRASDDGIYFLVHFIILLLVFDNKSGVFTDEARLNLGWVIIAASLICVIVNVTIMIHGQLVELIRFIRLLKNGKITGKVVYQTRSIKRRTQIISMKNTKKF